MELPADSLADRFAQRLELRDNPPPPAPPSHEPAAVQARLSAWLQANYRPRQQRTLREQTLVLLALVEQPSLSIRQLMPVLGLGLRGTQRLLQVMADQELLTYSAPGGKRRYRLAAATEDALLPVVRGD